MSLDLRALVWRSYEAVPDPYDLLLLLALVEQAAPSGHVGVIQPVRLAAMVRRPVQAVRWSLLNLTRAGVIRGDAEGRLWIVLSRLGPGETDSANPVDNPPVRLVRPDDRPIGGR